MVVIAIITGIFECEKKRYSPLKAEEEKHQSSSFMQIDNRKLRKKRERKIYGCIEILNSPAYRKPISPACRYFYVKKVVCLLFGDGKARSRVLFRLKKLPHVTICPIFLMTPHKEER